MWSAARRRALRILPPASRVERAGRDCAQNDVTSMHILSFKQMFAPDRSLRQAIHCVNAQNWGRAKGRKFNQGHKHRNGNDREMVE
jgi:hypothetical protein